MTAFAQITSVVGGPSRRSALVLAIALAASAATASAQAPTSRQAAAPSAVAEPWFMPSLRLGAGISTLTQGAGPGWRTGLMAGAGVDTRAWEHASVGLEAILQEAGGVAFTATTIPGLTSPTLRTRSLQIPLLLHYDTSRPDILGPDFLIGPAVVVLLQADASANGLQADLFKSTDNRPVRNGKAWMFGMGLPFATPYGPFRVELRHVRGSTEWWSGAKDRIWTVSLAYGLR